MTAAQGDDTIQTIASFMQLYADMIGPYLAVTVLDGETALAQFGKKRKGAPQKQRLRVVSRAMMTQEENLREDRDIKAGAYEVLEDAVDSVALGARRRSQQACCSVSSTDTMPF